MTWRMQRTNTPHFYWQRKSLLFVPIIYFVLVVFAAASQETPQSGVWEGETQRPVAFGKGLLWRITAGPSPSEEESPSYLFGTIHSEDSRVTQLPAAVQHAFNSSTSFCAELSFDPSTLEQLGHGMRYSDGQNLQAILGADLFGRVVPLMTEHGVPQSAVSHLKPWAIFMTLSMPKPQTGLFLDMILYEMAKQQGKSVCGLETPVEQIEIFDHTPITDQVVLVRETVKQYASLHRLFTALLERYLARDLAGLIALTEANTPTMSEEKRIYEAFLHRLVNERNARMVDRLLPRLREGGAFIAIGALHLPGDQGVLRLLQDRGYQVSAVY